MPTHLLGYLLNHKNSFRKFSSNTSQVVKVELSSEASFDKLGSSLPTKCTCPPSATTFFASEEPIEPVAPKIIFSLRLFNTIFLNE